MGWSVKRSYALCLLVTGLLSWAIPGAGYHFLGEKRRAIIIFIAIVLTFFLGLYIGSIGVIDPVGARPWYAAQILTSPLVAILGYITAGGSYPVYGRPNEIGQLYTSIAGLLNFLCIVNAVYLAHQQKTGVHGG